MKRILITGANSYVGVSVEQYLSSFPGRYQVDTLDMIGGGWKKVSFSGYDSVLHVAGIVHLTGDKAREAEQLYHQVNTQLAVQTAQKAKEEGVSQFIFMSSASVYGENGSLGSPKIIKRDTPLAPVNAYGLSKCNAEKLLQPLDDESFHVAILRPPMIYGRGCKGNYQTLAKLAKKLPVFPKVDNQRSMLYMGNLAEFVRLVIENCDRGIFLPQDKALVNTSCMVRLIAQANGKKILLIPGLTWALRCLRPMTAMVDKAFGSLYYDPELSRYPQDYQLYSLEQAIRETENG